MYAALSLAPTSRQHIPRNQSTRAPSWSPEQASYFRHVILTEKKKRNRHIRSPHIASIKRGWASQYQTRLGEPVLSAVGRTRTKCRWASQYYGPLGKAVLSYVPARHRARSAPCPLGTP